MKKTNKKEQTYERARCFSGQTFSYLTKDQMIEMHRAALQILQEVGSDVQHEGAREMLKKAGCRVEGERVYVTPGIVEWAIQQAPSTILVYNREGELAMNLSGRNAHFGIGSDCPNIYDRKTKTHRRYTTQDVINTIRLADALPNIDFIMSSGLLYDYPGTDYEHQYAIMLRNSVKPQVVVAADKPCLENIVEMAIAIRGSKEALVTKPLMVLYNEPTSPLIHTDTAIDKLIYCAEMQIPTNYAPAIMPGATGPITNAGSMIQGDAELLLGLVIHQLTRPGAPFVFGGAMCNMDMQSTQPTYSSPESIVCNSAFAQMGRELYGLPTWGDGGVGGGAMLPDEQAMNEATQFTFINGLAGTNIIHDLGYLNYGLTYCQELLVMQNEVVGQLRRIFDGIDMSEESKAMPVIKKVGPGGHFLGQKHTKQHYKEMWLPQLQNRLEYTPWLKQGGKTMCEKAGEVVDEIIANYEPLPVAPEKDALIQAVLDRVDKEAAEKEAK